MRNANGLLLIVSLKHTTATPRQQINMILCCLALNLSGANLVVSRTPGITHGCSYRALQDLLIPLNCYVLR